MSVQMNSKDIKVLFANLDTLIRRSESALIRKYAHTLETYREDYMRFLRVQEELDNKCIIPRNRQSANIVSPFSDEKEFYYFAKEVLTLLSEEIMLLLSTAKLPESTRSDFVKQYEIFAAYAQKISDKKSYDVAINAITMLVQATLQAH